MTRSRNQSCILASQTLQSLSMQLNQMQEWEFVFGGRSLFFLMFFVNNCVQVADSTIMCSGWAICQPIGDGVGFVDVWGRGWYIFMCSLICQSICFLVPNVSCVCWNFVNGDFVRGPIHLLYNCCYEEHVWVVML